MTQLRKVVNSILMQKEFDVVRVL